MTHRERFIRTMKCEKIGGPVPHFEQEFSLTMEAFGRVHHSQRTFHYWDQMSARERLLHIKDEADLYIQIAKRYDHSAIFVQPHVMPSFERTQWLCEEIRAQSGDEYYLMVHGDPTWGIPNGTDMLDFCTKMYEEPEVLNEQSQQRMDEMLELAAKWDQHGHLLDGFALDSDYCFNTNSFFSEEMFDELIAPYLKGVIDGYRSMGYYTYKHTDGNIMPIVAHMAACGPDAIHSIDPQGGVSLPKIREIVGDDICLIGNVNCGLLLTGTDEECDADVMRALREGMANGRGYIFSTSNSIYPGMPLERYERMVALWRQHGHYD